MFAYKRQELLWPNIDLNYENNKVADNTLKTYKFTNCYRSCDRVSQYLIKSVIYNEDHSPEDTFLRILLFKLFNKIETWEYLQSKLLYIGLENFSIDRIGNMLEARLNIGLPIYSGAYIMPSGVSAFGHPRKHINNLMLLQKMLNDGLASRIWEMKNLQTIYNTFLSYPSLGKFLAFQFAIDIAYAKYSEADESQFVVAGPGAVRGINKCFSNKAGYSYEDIIRIVTDEQERAFEEYSLDFKYLGNRKLQLIDCQNIFCEVDKYCRQIYPELDVKKKRIKQKYRPTKTKINYFFPPKWQIEI